MSYFGNAPNYKLLKAKVAQQTLRRLDKNFKSFFRFTGKRVKRGLYRSQNGTAINADANGAYNILPKSNLKFSFEELVKKVGEGILD